jgi:hypothetical protein
VTGTRLHHVVFAIALERLDAAAAYLTELGFQFQAFNHDELGLAIRLDWDRGFELISPLPGAPQEAGSAAEFLARSGDGLFSVVVRIDDCDAAEHLARRHGVNPDFRQRVEGDGFEVAEVKLEPLFGIPLTLLETTLPGPLCGQRCANKPASCLARSDFLTFPVAVKGNASLAVIQMNFGTL